MRCHLKNLQCKSHWTGSFPNTRQKLGVDGWGSIRYTCSCARGTFRQSKKDIDCMSGNEPVGSFSKIACRYHILTFPFLWMLLDRTSKSRLNTLTKMSFRVIFSR
jgi:hypothetical protein